MLDQMLNFHFWFFIGFCIYGFYGINHSEQGKRDKAENKKLQQMYVEKFRIVTSFWSSSLYVYTTHVHVHLNHSKAKQ